MTDKHSKSENKVDRFFSRITEEAEDLPIRIIDIPAKNDAAAGLCLIAEERQPALGIDELAAVITADFDTVAPCNAPRKEDLFSAVQESLSIEIERARFTSTSLSLVLIKTTSTLDEKLRSNPASLLKDALHRVDIVAVLDNTVLAILMPETGGHAAEQRASRFLASMGHKAAGCGIYSNHGSGCPEPADFINGALQKLEISCSESGRVFRNEYKGPASCQVTVEEKSELFNLFGRDK